MPVYAYKATNAGRVVSGEIAAENDRQARVLLRESGVTPLSLTERETGRARPPALAWLTTFTRQLGTLLKAGFPMDKALTSMAGSSPDPRARAVLTTIDEGVRRGLRLSDSVARAYGLRGDGNNPTNAAAASGNAAELVAILEAGEAAGDLAPVLLNYAGLLEKRLLFRRRLRGALFYPLIVASLAVVVVIFLFIYVVPTITKLFEGTQMPLPLPTQVLMVVASAVQFGFAPGIVILLVGGWALRRWYQTSAGHLRAEQFLHGLPGIGRILEKAAFARWLRTFGTLLANNVEILAALDLAARTASSVRLQRAITAARPRVAEGVPLARAVAETGIFPPMTIEAITLGEASGTLPNLLMELAAAWEGEVESSAEAFADLLEPLVLVGMGLLVGGIVLAVLLPIFEFNSTVH